jgi:hypothetical protein
MMSAATARKVSTTVQIRRNVVEKSAQIIYARFPQFTAVEEADRKYFATFVTSVLGVGLIALLIINTLLAQDAFILSQLKLEAKHVADQRDAVNRTIDRYASPSALASKAAALGMKPSENPVFLNLAAQESGLTRG